jgi:NAD(P)-dependent dehydrogenase (short-subunit alcohol dehydrogenase family)
LGNEQFRCRAVIPYMLEIGGGSIINVSSDNGLVGSTTAAADGAAKVGVVVLT